MSFVKVKVSLFLSLGVSVSQIHFIDFLIEFINNCNHLTVKRRKQNYACLFYQLKKKWISKTKLLKSYIFLGEQVSQQIFFSDFRHILPVLLNLHAFYMLLQICCRSPDPNRHYRGNYMICTQFIQRKRVASYNVQIFVH